MQGSSFRDLETAAPSSVAAGAQPGVPEGESSRSSSQALSEEQRSNSIGEELKMVMKSERGGRLARNSAELLAGDRPGEFTVVTEEGSTIPVAVKDVAAAGPTSNAPNSAAALKDVSAPAPATSAPNSAAALKDVAAAAPATSAPKSTAAGDAPVSEVTPTRNWWGSMTAALGLKAATEGEPAPPSRPAEARPEAEAAQAPPGEQSEAAATAEQSEAAAAAEQQPLAVSAFARDVAVKPVSAETADSSAVQGRESFNRCSCFAGTWFIAELFGSVLRLTRLQLVQDWHQAGFTLPPKIFNFIHSGDTAGFIMVQSCNVRVVLAQVQLLRPGMW